MSDLRTVIPARDLTVPCTLSLLCDSDLLWSPCESRVKKMRMSFIRGGFKVPRVLHSLVPVQGYRMCKPSKTHKNTHIDTHTSFIRIQGSATYIEDNIPYEEQQPLEEPEARGQRHQWKGQQRRCPWYSARASQNYSTTINYKNVEEVRADMLLCKNSKTCRRKIR